MFGVFKERGSAQSLGFSELVIIDSCNTFMNKSLHNRGNCLERSLGSTHTGAWAGGVGSGSAQRQW